MTNTNKHLFLKHLQVSQGWMTQADDVSRADLVKLGCSLNFELIEFILCPKLPGEALLTMMAEKQESNWKQMRPPKMEACNWSFPPLFHWPKQTSWLDPTSSRGGGGKLHSGSNGRDYKITWQRVWRLKPVSQWATPTVALKNFSRKMQTDRRHPSLGQCSSMDLIPTVDQSLY